VAGQQFEYAFDEMGKQSGYSTEPTYADKMMQFYRQLGCK